MLTVLGGLAEFERELIRARTGEGRKRAQAGGVKFGRPPKLRRDLTKASSLQICGEVSCVRSPSTSPINNPTRPARPRMVSANMASPIPTKVSQSGEV
jgi:hypothetical protein